MFTDSELLDADPNVWAKSIHDFTQAMLSQVRNSQFQYIKETKFQP